MTLHALALTLQLKLWLVMAATRIQVLHTHEALLAGRDGMTPLPGSAGGPASAVPMPEPLCQVSSRIRQRGLPLRNGVTVR
jgi:hypothetical protein